MTTSTTSPAWNGAVAFEGDVVNFNIHNGRCGEKMTLSEAERRILGESDNMKIVKIEVFGYCMTQIFDFTIFKYYLSKPDSHLVIIHFENGEWWSFSFIYLPTGSMSELPESLLAIVKHGKYSGLNTTNETIGRDGLFGHLARELYKNLMTFSWLVKSDESKSNVKQLFKWLQSKSMPDNQFADFTKEIFNKLARIKTWERLQGVVRSPWKQKGGNQWSGALRYIHPSGREDLEDHQIMHLKDMVDSDRANRIVKVKVYKIPLDEKYLTNLILFHSYVVFQTHNEEGKDWWWSLEKNTQCIALQKGATEASVRDWLGGEKRCESRWYWKPQLVDEGTCGGIGLADLIVDFLHGNDELNITYHGITENCQCLAKEVFSWLTNKELNYGMFASAVTGINRWWTGISNPRPRIE